MVAEIVNRCRTFTSTCDIATSWQQYNNWNCLAFAICIWIRKILCIRALYIWTRRAIYAWCMYETNIRTRYKHSVYAFDMYMPQVHSTHTVDVCTICAASVCARCICPIGAHCTRIACGRCPAPAIPRDCKAARWASGSHRGMPSRLLGNIVGGSHHLCILNMRPAWCGHIHSICNLYQYNS